MTTALSFIFVLGILVFVHELGYFIVARLCGIRVEKFSLGFPPKLVSRKVGETEYIISWIPLGGYVKLAGENPEESSGTNPWEFMAQPVWKRSLVIAAGPVMNFILAILFFWGIFFFNGLQVPQSETTVIGQLTPGGPAEKAGIKPGDKILSVNETPVTNFDQMAKIIYQNVEKPGGTHLHRPGRRPDRPAGADCSFIFYRPALGQLGHLESFAYSGLRWGTPTLLRLGKDSPKTT